MVKISPLIILLWWIIPIAVLILAEFDSVVSSFEYDVDFDDINDDVVSVVMREVTGIAEDWLDSKHQTGSLSLQLR